MPGIFGFISTSLPEGTYEASLQNMQNSLIYRPHHHPCPLYSDGTIAAGSVPILPGGARQTPYISDDLCVWIDGEFYPSSTAAAQPFAATIAEKCRNNLLRPFIEGVDGIFTAAIYHPQKGELLLVNDRYGIRQCYVARNRTLTAWASEIKALEHVPQLPLTLRQDSIDNLISAGHFSLDTTWFNEVTLLPPASFIRISLHDDSITTSRYRKIENSGFRSDRISLDKEAQVLGQFFRSAVEKRCVPGERVGLGLSGGLDSRALFAALPAYVNPVPAVTFGRAGCSDISIAHKVAALRPSTHTINEIHAGNWLDHRLEGVRITDGQISLLHLHGIEAIDNYRNLYDVELNGFLGDALLGGSYGSAPEGEMARFYTRGRRLIATALVTGNLSYITRLPFFDNEFFDAYMSIPLAYRRHSQLYNRMLLAAFPEYYSSIPWQKTGIPISQSGTFARWRLFSVKLYRKLTTAITGNNSADYFDYAGWIRLQPARSFFEELLYAPDLMLASYVDNKKIREDLQAHFAGRDRSEKICNYVTAEIWLRQFYKKELLR